ncbi:hypothetical protein TREES_T100002570 [Tupaia chinensis]|uniref:Uncharacterized protein n=1 Tax=Tupaia chinensis TaxID=246437 RepID=L9L9N7_TUPCH|nr:hypothetical protein TREES_T100002570 [Tupaia chinensis]
MVGEPRRDLPEAVHRHGLCLSKGSLAAPATTRAAMAWGSSYDSSTRPPQGPHSLPSALPCRALFCDSLQAAAHGHGSPRGIHSVHSELFSGTVAGSCWGRRKPMKLHLLPLSYKAIGKNRQRFWKLARPSYTRNPRTPLPDSVRTSCCRREEDEALGAEQPVSEGRKDASPAALIC